MAGLRAWEKAGVVQVQEEVGMGLGPDHAALLESKRTSRVLAGVIG